MNGHLVALILAVIALAAGVVARVRVPLNGSKGAPLYTALLLLPCGGIIGTLPWVLQLGETVKIAASIASIVASVAASVLLVIQMRRA